MLYRLKMTGIGVNHKGSREFWMHLKVQTPWSCRLSCALLRSKVITITLTRLLLHSITTSLKSTKHPLFNSLNHPSCVCCWDYPSLTAWTGNPEPFLQLCLAAAAVLYCLKAKKPFASARMLGLALKNVGSAKERWNSQLSRFFIFFFNSHWKDICLSDPFVL